MEGNEIQYDLRIVDLFERIASIFPLWKHTALCDEEMVVKMASHWTFSLLRSSTQDLISVCDELEQLPKLPQNMLEAVKFCLTKIDNRRAAAKRDEEMREHVSTFKSKHLMNEEQLIRAYLNGELPKSITATGFFKEGLDKRKKLVERIARNMPQTINNVSPRDDTNHGNMMG